MLRQHWMFTAISFLTVANWQLAAAQTLRSLAERKDLKIGVMANDATWNTEQQKNLVKSEFNVVTVGTYWTRTHPARDQYEWGVTDDLVNWADGENLGVHLHPLLYPANEHNPQWVKDSPHSEAPAILEEFITTAMDRYRGVVDVWDVVNEAVRPHSAGGYRESWWLDAMGPDYVIEAYRIARRHDPNAILLYNENSIELANDYQTGRWNTTKDILTPLNNENLVDGLGWQLHTTPEKVLDQPLALAERMQWVEELGLKNFVTELDVAITDGDEQLDRQAEAYQRIAEIWLEHHNGGWFQTWGVYDTYTWLGSAKRPLLFDAQYQPKPAYEAMQEALETVSNADADADGDVDGNDFLNWQQGLNGDESDASGLNSWMQQFPQAPTDPPESPSMVVPEANAVLLQLAACAWVATSAVRIPTKGAGDSRR